MDWPEIARIATGVVFGIVGFSPQVAKQWERGIVLRLGRFIGAKGPGLFFIIPFIDRVASVIDQRVITSTFNAEETLTRDTVPVTVDAVLFWHVHDVERAALEVQDYNAAVARASQTALRDLIGRTTLAELLVGREKMEKQLQDMIDTRIGQWGVTVQTVEMRDVVIPRDLQEAMSREAQAEREKNARVILGHAEVLIAEQFKQAGQIYADQPVALHLRAMNILYEGLKEKGALMVVPSSAVESMGLGSFAGIAALNNLRPPTTPPPAV
jgi:regulator of protease activity HflC (stomatin/prohibitin superfamily)